MREEPEKANLWTLKGWNCRSEKLIGAR